jgi:sugar phosphate isomerase/epimerase
MSTIRGQKLTVPQQVDLAAKTGYDGIEPWIRDLQGYKEAGGSLADLKKRIADHGLTVESAIGFPQWSVDDEAQRKQGIETLKHDMDLVRQIGGTRIAAPPVGAHGGDAPKLDLFAVAERYAAILDIGRDLGVTPMVEIWGPSKNLSRLGEAVFVAVESSHPDACVLPDIYHIYRGGSGFEGLKLLAGTAVPVFHVNDYPGGRNRTELNDGDRVHVGDGVAPTDMIFKALADNGCRAALSLELFNKSYWEQDAEKVAREGLEKTKAAVERALG